MVQTPSRPQKGKLSLTPENKSFFLGNIKPAKKLTFTELRSQIHFSIKNGISINVVKMSLSNMSRGQPTRKINSREETFPFKKYKISILM